MGGGAVLITAPERHTLMPLFSHRRVHAATALASVALIVTPVAAAPASAYPAHPPKPHAIALTQPGVGPQAAPNGHATAATLAGQWLAGQLVDGGIPGFAGSDWGLTIDVLIALEVTGADPGAATEVADAVATNVDAYATGGEFAPDLRVAGATAKLLYAAAVAGRDPTSFGGHDLRARTLDLVAGSETGRQHGWVKNRDSGGFASGGNMFDQSLAVLGLARSGGVPQQLVAFLIGQQCPAGGFRLFPPADGTPCPASNPAEQLMDPDTTGMAIQALLAADAAGAAGAGTAADQAVAWLLAVQQPTGAFHGSALLDFPNTNSTGLAGLALAAAGETAAADRAADWVIEQQLSRANAGPAGAHVGAIGYTPDARTEAIAGGIPDFALDQWRRSTAQAVLALAKIPLGEAGITEPRPGPRPSPSGSPGPASPTPTAPGGAGELPATGAPAMAMAVTGGGVLAAGVLLLMLSARRRNPLS
jgi:LPXTG-motif cell wall-anchored protein